MAEQRHLDHAPIAEALVDLQTSLPDDFDLERFRALQHHLINQFPIVDQLFEQHATVTITGAQPFAVTPPPRRRGYAFRSSDGLTIAQFRRDGFTLNRLRSYTSWDELRPQALTLWDLYRQTSQAPPCTRIALRYINQIEVPLPAADLREYFIAPPAIPEGSPQLLTEFFTRIVLTDPVTGLMVGVVQATQPSRTASVGTVLLDIDAYRAADGGIPHNDVARTLDSLRALKNNVFFGSITETTVRRYL